MMNTTKQILSKGFMYTLILLVCLSCPVKRELKRVFNIPVSSVEQTNKPNKTQLCQFTVDQSANGIHYQAIAKQIQLPDSFQFISVVSITPEQPAVSRVSYHQTVPIYIQNEQFLI